MRMGVPGTRETLPKRRVIYDPGEGDVIAVVSGYAACMDTSADRWVINGLTKDLRF